MRNDQDIKKVTISLTGTVEIDLERVESDPYWELVAGRFNIQDPAQFKQALEQYICRYLGQETVMEYAPFTCGPAAIIGFNAEVL